MPDKIVIKKSGTTLMEAWESARVPDRTLPLVIERGLKGWDEVDEIYTVNTQPKAFGHGSYVIERRLGERPIEISIDVVKGPTPTTSIRGWLTLFKQELFAGSALTVERISLTDAGAELEKEVLGVELRGVATADWRVQSGTLILTLIATDPVKALYIGGSSTPVPGGAL